MAPINGISGLRKSMRLKKQAKSMKALEEKNQNFLRSIQEGRVKKLRASVRCTNLSKVRNIF
jgi:hypothetical protein